MHLKTKLPQVTLQTRAQTSAKLTLRQSITEETEATTPELGSVGFWSPKSSAIVVEEAARNF